MQITLDFIEGTNPPGNGREVIIFRKKTNSIHNGFCFDIDSINGYRLCGIPDILRPEQVMWAEQPKNINNTKKL